EPWAAPSGLHGGGLGMSPAQSGRVWTDVAFFTRAESTEVRPGFTLTRRGFTLLSPIFGVGVLVTPNVEIAGVIPVGTTIADEGGTGIGNPFLGEPRALFAFRLGPHVLFAQIHDATRRT